MATEIGPNRFGSFEKRAPETWREYVSINARQAVVSNVQWVYSKARLNQLAYYVRHTGNLTFVPLILRFPDRDFLFEH